MAKGESKVFVKIYKVVRKIPKGKVATYGQIAKIVKTSPRIVGWALHANTDRGYPCHRVVDRNGKVAENYAFGGWREQKKKLKEEGVGFKDKLHVDLEKYHWKKEKL